MVDKRNGNLRPRHGKQFPILAKKFFQGRAQKQGLDVGKRVTINYSLLTIKIFNIMALKVKAVEKNIKFKKGDPGVWRYVMQPKTALL